MMTSTDRIAPGEACGEQGLSRTLAVHPAPEGLGAHLTPWKMQGSQSPTQGICGMEGTQVGLKTWADEAPFP